MAMFGFGKKKRVEEQAVPGTPFDQIAALKQQGMSNDQIIQEMEKQGYNSSQIFEALNQSNMVNAGPEPLEMPPQEVMSQEQIVSQPPPEPKVDKEQIEEVAEAIIDEKWKEFEDDIKVIIDWKEKTENRINQFEQKIKDLSISLGNLHKGVLGKISEYDKGITDVGVEIKAMEKVFQKVLPSLTENVNKLDRIAKGSKLKK
jgi:DNA-binding transcriptional MerR regulator